MLYFVKIEAFLSLMIIDILQMFGEVPSLVGIITFFFFMFHVHLVSLCIVLNNGLSVLYKNNKFDEITVILKMERA